MLKDEIKDYLQRRRYLAQPWASNTKISRAFGYDGAQSHIDQALASMLRAGDLERRPAQGQGRTRWEYALAAEERAEAG